MLETRCLLSGWFQNVGPDPDRVRAIERPASDVASGRTQRRPNSTHHSASQDPDTNYAEGSTVRPDVTPGLAGLPQVDYVIVPEISTPHDTLPSAQSFPDLPYFGVIGTLDVGDGVDLYRLTLDRISDRIDFGLVMRGSDANVPATFQLLDGSGQVLASWKLGSLGSSTIQVDLDNRSPGSSVYLAFSAGNSSTASGAFGAVDYQLWVAHQPALQPTSSATGSSAQPALAVPVLPPLLIPLAAGGLPSPQVDAAAALTAPRSAVSTVTVTVGSLAIRSAGASLGLLTNDELAPLAAQGAGISSPQEVAAESMARTGSESGGEPRPSELAVPGRDPEARVVVVGTGGFPLMGATAVGYWRERGPAPEAFPGMTAPALEERSEGVESTDDHDLQARPAVSLAEGEVIASDQASRLRTWRGFPVSVFSGLGVATVLTLNAVLSQPIAGYDYLTAKLYRSGIRAFSRRTPSKSLAAPHGRRRGAEPPTQLERNG